MPSGCGGWRRPGSAKASERVVSGLLWGGRFDSDPDRLLWDYTTSTWDRRLLFDDVAGSQAHVKMLGEVGLLSASEAEQLHLGLDQISADAADGTFEFVDGDEDVHSAVERRLYELVGDVAGKLHTGRSRNDQVALDLRLYLRRSGRQRAAQLRAFAISLADLAETHAGTPIATYTHLQQAQTTSLGNHLLAHAWMAIRNAQRFDGTVSRLDVSPLGAGASAGSSLPIDSARTAQLLGFPSHFANTLDAVAARDFVADYAFCCAQAMVDLSRLAEEMILWSTSEFGWVTLADSHATGSSALPHKKNPDIAELARGRTATVIGALTALLVVQKGLPLTYNRDFQEDKQAVFTADDLLAATVDAIAGLVTSATFHPPAPGGFTSALTLAEALVTLGVTFRESHRVVGSLVKDLVADGRELAQVKSEELARLHPDLASWSIPDSVPDISRQLAELRAMAAAGT